MNSNYQPTRQELGELRGTFRGTLRSVSGLLVLLCTIVAIGGLVGQIRNGSVENLFNLGKDLCLVILVIGTLLFLFAKFHSVRVYSNGLEGKNYWSWPVRFHWDQIENVRWDSSNGLSAAVVVQKTTGREMWILRDVFLSQGFQLAAKSYLDKTNL